MEKQSNTTPANNVSKQPQAPKPKRQARENVAFTPLPPLAEPNIQEITKQLNREVKTTWVSLKDSAMVVFVIKHWFAMSVMACVLGLFYKYDLLFDLKPDGLVVESRILPAFQSETASTKLAMPSFTEKEVVEYVRRFEKVAMQEQEKFGVPAPLTLACGLVKSNAGKAVWAKESNNHFAIPCSKNLLSEGLLGEKELDGTCFANYENAWTSFRAHTMLLTQGKIGKATKGLSPNDVTAWVNAMTENGYGDEARLSLTLIKEHGL